MAGMNSGLSPNAVKTALDMVFQSEYDYPQLPGIATAENPLCFQQSSTDRGAVITELFQGPGYWQQRAELADVFSATSRIGNQKTNTVLNFASSVDIAKTYFDDDKALHDTVELMIRGMARNARLSRDKHAFNQYNLGFTTVTTPDGVALFSNSHVALNGATIDNLETGAFSESNLETMFNSLIAQKTQDGTLGGHEPAALLVPTALFKDAQEATKSELRSGTANNDMNYYSQIYPGLQVYHSPFLSLAEGGSNVAYFLLSRNHAMFRWVRQGVTTDLVDYKFQRNNNYIYKGEYREVVSPISFEGMVGSTGV